MRIIVRIGDLFWRVAGKRQIELTMGDGATAADVIAQLATVSPALAAELLPGGVTRGGLPYHIFVNRRRVAEADLAARRLKDGDSVHIISPTAGG
jgi:molybdopterin converting factor small subunit